MHQSYLRKHMPYWPASLLVFIIGCMWGAAARAQDQPSQIDSRTAGRHFIVAFPDTATDSGPLNPSLFLGLDFYIYSDVHNTATILSPSGSIRTITLEEGRFTRIDCKEYGSTLIARHNDPVPNGIRIETIEPAIAYAYMETSFGVDLWPVTPVEFWGTDYTALTLPGQVLTNVERGFVNRLSGQSYGPAPADIMIIAAYDDTRVSIAASSPLLDNPTLPVTLDAGEVYQIHSVVQTEEDKRTLPQPSLTGTRITANRPIGVIQGNTRMFTGGEVNAVTGNSMKTLSYEWLSPAGTHGREFVHTPVWDTYRQRGEGGENLEAVRPGESVFLFNLADSSTDVQFTDPLATKSELRRMEGQSELSMDITGQSRPGHALATRPLQMYSAPQAFSVLTDQSYGEGGIVLSLTYKTVPGAFEEVVPVEQWGTFAPFIAPKGGREMEYLLNVVTRYEWRNSLMIRAQGDVEKPFVFNRGRIPGTDYIWSSIPIASDRTYYIRGTEDARFTGSLYAVTAGSEAFAREVFSPDRMYYEQINGFIYAAPLAPRRTQIGDPDSVVLESSRDCSDLSVTAWIASKPASGFMSAELSRDAVNARLILRSPVTGSVNGENSIEFDVTPIENDKDAHATIVLTDRTGATTSVPYSYIAESLAVATAPPEMAPVTTGYDTPPFEIVLFEPERDTVPIHDVRMAVGSRFEIMSTDPPVPATLQPGQQLVITARYRTAGVTSTDIDTAVVSFGCNGQRKIPLSASTVTPCINLEDLDFGTVRTDDPRTLSLTITNSGEGKARFKDMGMGLVFGLDNGFSIEPDVLTALDGKELKPGESEAVPITFRSQDSGIFRTTIRFAANWIGCRDSSVLTAQVSAPVDTTTSVEEAGDAPTNATTLEAPSPNPVGESTTIRFSLARPDRAMLEILDQSGRVVARLLDREVDRGDYVVKWGPRDLPSGLYFMRLRSGSSDRIRPIVLLR